MKNSFGVIKKNYIQNKIKSTIHIYQILERLVKKKKKEVFNQMNSLV